MYASAMRLASEVMEDDRIKIGENGQLYRVSEIATIKMANKELVGFSLYAEMDSTKTIIAVLCVTPHTSLKVYNQ